MRLKKIDLSKSVESDGGYTHPAIKLGKWYLAKIKYEGSKPQLAAGKFTKQWYGLNFEGFYDAGLQFDPPGYNSSNWVALWEIIER